jgi:hypothetical protein
MFSRNLLSDLHPSTQVLHIRSRTRPKHDLFLALRVEQIHRTLRSLDHHLIRRLYRHRVISSELNVRVEEVIVHPISSIFSYLRATGVVSEDVARFEDGKVRADKVEIEAWGHGRSMDA